MQSFDFTQVASNHKNDFYDYLKTREQSARQRVHSRRPQSNRHVWLLVLVLCLCLVGLSAYTLYQEELFGSIVRDGNSEVAGVSSEKTQTLDAIVSGAEFSMVLPEKLPESFDIQISSGPFPYAGVRSEAQKTSILTQGSISSGIIVYVSEYDKRLDLDTYNQAILNDLGPAYEIENVSKLPNNYTLTAYSNGRSIQPTIYSSITSNNYYIIEVYTDPGVSPEVNSANAVTSTFLDNLYLN